jgi:hypothetical protein
LYHESHRGLFSLNCFYLISPRLIFELRVGMVKPQSLLSLEADDTKNDLHGHLPLNPFSKGVWECCLPESTPQLHLAEIDALSWGTWSFRLSRNFQLRQP